MDEKSLVCIELVFLRILGLRMNSLTSLPHKSRLFLTIEEAVDIWLSTLSPLTKKNYSSGIKFLITHGVLKSSLRLEDLLHIDHSDVLYKIKSLRGSRLNKPISEASKQARAACYISFTRFLYRFTKGLLKQAIPSREFKNATFYKIRDRVKTKFISKKEWLIFFDSLRKISHREYLIGKLIIQGVRKLSEVISLRVEDISFSQNQINFYVKKRQNRSSEVKIIYPNFLIDELKQYIGNRNGWVFVSEGSSKKVSVNQVYHHFDLAKNDIQLSTKVTPHVLRASALVYLKQTGFSDAEIMRISCLSSHETISAYDVYSEKNITSVFPLIF